MNIDAELARIRGEQDKARVELERAIAELDKARIEVVKARQRIYDMNKEVYKARVRMDGKEEYDRAITEAWAYRNRTLDEAWPEWGSAGDEWNRRVDVVDAERDRMITEAEAKQDKAILAKGESNKGGSR